MISSRENAANSMSFILEESLLQNRFKGCQGQTQSNSFAKMESQAPISPLFTQTTQMAAGKNSSKGRFFLLDFLQEQWTKTRNLRRQSQKSVSEIYLQVLFRKSNREGHLLFSQIVYFPCILARIALWPRWTYFKGQLSVKILNQSRPLTLDFRYAALLIKFRSW